MLTEQQVRWKIESTSDIRFQYKKVQNLILVVQRMNISQPLTSFEQLLVSQEKQKMLSQVYKILLEKNMAVDRVPYK